jgi:uncharacterized protein with HEPN domain
MSSKDSKLNPAEIIHHARRRIARILEWTKNATNESYARDEMLQAAVERNFIAVGEAIKDLARVADLAKLDPQGPWNKPANFRDFLAHCYNEAVSSPAVLGTAHRDLPLLDAALARIEPLVGGPYIP